MHTPIPAAPSGGPSWYAVEIQPDRRGESLVANLVQIENCLVRCHGRAAPDDAQALSSRTAQRRQKLPLARGSFREAPARLDWIAGRLPKCRVSRNLALARRRSQARRFRRREVRCRSTADGR